MKVPSNLIEKTFSAIQIANLSGELKTGLFECIRSLESGKCKYLVLSLDTSPRNKKLQKKFAMLEMLAKDKKVPVFKLSTKKILGNLINIPVGVSCIAVTKPDRAESIFKSLKEEVAGLV